MIIPVQARLQHLSLQNGTIWTLVESNVCFNSFIYILFSMQIGSILGGPFDSQQMQTWYSSGYFNNTLMLCRLGDTSYISLGIGLGIHTFSLHLFIPTIN
jgi:hypothetical protein